MKKAFLPITIDKYVELHLKSNPDCTRGEITTAIRKALDASKRGERCDCGNSIWVIGSAVAGYACFTCITGEAQPDSDYEIDEACS